MKDHNERDTLLREVSTARDKICVTGIINGLRLKREIGKVPHAAFAVERNPNNMKIFDHQSGSYVKVGDASIYYEQTGNPAGPSLLLLHGGFGTVEDFNPLIPALDPSFHIIGMDSRGHGKSTLGNTGLSYEHLQEDVESVLKQLNIKETSVFGISDGGVVAYRLAAYSSLEIDKLITIGARWHRSNVRETYDLLRGTTAESWKKKFPETVALYEQLNPEPDFDLLARNLVQMWLNEESYPDQDVSDIKAQTLIIRGDRDPLTKRQFVAQLADLIRNANLSNIAFAGHEAYREQAAIVTDVIRQFLAH